MQNMETERGETARQEHGNNPGIDGNITQRRRDRRVDTAELFGGYQGPERRSGRDRRNG